MKWIVMALVVACSASAAAAAPLELAKGDHICIIGNTLAENMQHHGWLETYLQHRFPDQELVVRNLGFSGDELVLRLRSAGFGTPDEHLTACQADVVLAFFGYNESFGGEAGLANFEKELDEFIKHTLEQKYNGSSPPKLVIFSPIAHEDLHNRNLPDGSENNERIRLYTNAMYEAAKRNHVVFVDLFRPSIELYAKSPRPLTINGIHLTVQGDHLLAPVIDEALFGPSEAAVDAGKLEKLRAAVLDKDFIWFNRYRTVDGYSIFGGRADLKFVNGQTNREVMKREMEVLDVMTANRDQRIWAVARGGDRKVDDSNTPPFIPVITNKPGNGPNGEHLFLGGEAAIAQMTVAKGMQVNLFASEEQFPDLAKPVQMTFDPQGRLWVAVMPSYPHWKPKEEMNDKVLVIEDVDHDGRADKCTVFADKLHVPTGLELFNGGVLVGQQPDLVFLKDTDGDGVADYRERFLHGMDSADTHHALNSFTLDPGGALYFQEGTFHHTQVETPWAAATRSANAASYRYEPRTQKFEVYVPYGFANPHGHVFDHWGQDFITDGTGNVNYFAAGFSGHLNFPDKHPRMEAFYKQRSRPCPGTEIISSRHFPPENQGNYLDANVIGFQGIFQYKLHDEGSGFGADEVEPIVFSSDPNFRPADMEMGPDGALYFLDWQNPIIGHMQHNLRDPSRDRVHGRVYRVTCIGRPLLKPTKIAGEPIEKLLDLLKEPEDRVRYRAKIELGARDSQQVAAAAKKWAAALDPKDPDFAHHQLEALWVHQYHNVVDVALLERVLRSPDFHARAAATRVLCYWRDRVPGALDLLKQQAADEHPRVRLEATRAASFFRVPEAIDIPLMATERSTDYYLDYVRTETMRALEPYWKPALAAGVTIPVTSEAATRFILRETPLEKLLALPRIRPVYEELLSRPHVSEDVRREAVTALARKAGISEARVLIDTIRSNDEKTTGQDESVLFDLVRLLHGRNARELSAVRSDLEQLATKAKTPLIRQVGFVALVSVDNSVQPAWQLAAGSVPTLVDLVSAMPLVPDASLRAELYPKIEPLLEKLPPELAAKTSKKAGSEGRYVRVELPRKGTLTLAEVEVYGMGRNLARGGKATQSTTAGGGDAAKAIDGNTSGSFGKGGQTHTQENGPKPWWQVDLGADYPIDSIVIYNRTDGKLGKRLDRFTLRVLDSRGHEVLHKDKIPAPQPKAEFKLAGASPEALVRRAAMNALASVRGQEAKTFDRLARFVREDVDRLAAIRALERIPRASWPKEQAGPLLDVVLAEVRAMPPANRTSPAALDELEFADALVSLLPADRAKSARKELGELGVRVIRMGTLLERMSYDKDMIVLRAGKPVQFIFENSDFMPHNFVIAQPGAMEELGLAAEATATSPDAAKRNYVPRSNKILLASTLLLPRDSQKLDFVAPTAPGVYPYVCTYPGHWRRMYGAMYVVDDLDGYLANPAAYLASHPLPIKDELLKDRRPRTEWKLEDLAAGIEGMTGGRSHGNGKQMFTVASCVACHRLDNVGNQFGPELTKLDPKLKPIDILREMLDPSIRINEKFQTWIFATDDGKTVTGLVLEETPTTVKVIENPLAKAQPIELKKTDIVAREKSPLSIMPKGLLDKLSREEIADLVAYIACRGNADSPLFRGGGHEHQHHGH
ncbi:MAG TPA: PVC-type heme-binding CxxCH protein [Pirellulales bacterium]|jgi:putative heme-binding domain-containing protein|nr:PVC-type heme-binding CxxCH protein [Pirellulales bacterium]